MKKCLITLLLFVSTFCTKGDNILLSDYKLANANFHEVKGLPYYTKYTFVFIKDVDTVTLIFRSFQPTFSSLFCPFQIDSIYTISLNKISNSNERDKILNSCYYKAFWDSSLTKRKITKRNSRRNFISTIDYCEVDYETNFYHIAYIRPCDSQTSRHAR